MRAIASGTQLNLDTEQSAQESAERLRIAMRLVRAKGYQSDRDLLDWLKYAQSETDGVKLDLTKLAALVADEAPLARS